MKGMTACPVALTLLTIVSSARAQTAEQIIDRYIEAIGGRQAIAAIETMRYVRTVQNTEEGVTTQQSQRTIYSKRSYFYRTEDHLSSRASICDGTSAWTGRPVAGTDSISWQEASFVLRSPDADFDRLFGSFINFSQKGYVAEFTGVSKLEDVQLQVVRLTWKEGHQWDFYFDPSTGLCFGFDASPNLDDGFVRADDYRRIDGILIPHRNTSTDRLPDGRTRRHERIYSGIELNPVLHDSLFFPPPIDSSPS
jgi:hypothetical protein